MKPNYNFVASTFRMGIEIAFLVILLAGSASAGTIKVCKIGTCDYSTIQDAISAAIDGDLIEVQSGIYVENVEVTKRLSLKGVSNPVVDAGGSGSAIILSAGESIVEGFTAVNSGGGFFDSGISVKSSNNVVSNNNASGNNGNGIFLSPNSNNNMLEGNTARWNGINGIGIYSSSSNIVMGNTVEWNKKYGIFIASGSRNITLLNNNINSNIETGILTQYSGEMTFIGNTLDSNKNGISMNKGAYNNLSNNIIMNSNTGVFFFSTWYSNLTDNIIKSNDIGVHLGEETHDNFISSNTISDNGQGILILAGYGGYGSYDNVIYNNFFSNTINANDNGFNSWNITKTYGTNIMGGSWLGGNYWSDYSGADTDGDGLGNTQLPYNSTGGIINNGDFLPLTPRPIAPVQELPTFALLGIGLFSLLFIMRRR